MSSIILHDCMSVADGSFPRHDPVAAAKASAAADTGFNDLCPNPLSERMD